MSDDKQINEKSYQQDENSSVTLNKKFLTGKRVKIISIIGIIALVSFLFYYLHAITYVSTDDAYVDGHIIRLSSKVPGNVLKVYVKDNQRVKKGDLLVEIDPIDYQVRYQLALARLDAAIEKFKSAKINVGLTSIISNAAVVQAMAQVNANKAKIIVSDKDITQAAANLAQINKEVDSVKTEFELAKIEMERCQALFPKGGVSKQDLDRAETNYKTLKYKFNAAQEKSIGAKAALDGKYASKVTSLNNLEESVGKLKSVNTVPQLINISDLQKRTTNAEIRQLQASLKQAELELSYTKIYAPEDGQITSKSVEEGAYIQTGQPLLSLIPVNTWVVANFKETQITNIRPNQLVNIKVDAYPGQIFKGHVDSIQFSTGSKTSLFPPENAVGSFVKVVQRVPVKILFDDTISNNYVIAPGLSVIPEVKIR